MRVPIKHLRGIFWKIFFAFWAANLIIMVVTTYIITKGLEQKEIDRNDKLYITDIVKEIVQRYENDEYVRHDQSLRRMIRKYNMLKKTHIPPFTITNDESDKIFRYRNGMISDGVTHHQFPYMSQQSKAYRVDVYVRYPKKFVLHSLRRLNNLQVILVLIASTVVSFLLSWSISSPLKKLGSASRQFRGGEGEFNIDKTLLKRRDEIGDLSRDFQYMSQQVEGNIESQKQLLHDVSHELRAPLARLQTTVGVLEQKTPKDAQYFERLHSECEKISTLIQNILNFSRMDHRNLERETVNVADFISGILENVQFEFSEIPIDTINLAGSVEACIFPELLEAALGNVVRNACKYSASRTVVTLSANAEQVTIEVRDFGPGVDEGEIDKLLTPFYRSGNVMHSDGHGLGLSIASRAMEKHDGSLTLANHAEGGLLAVLCFPAKGARP